MLKKTFSKSSFIKNKYISDYLNKSSYQTKTLKQLLQEIDNKSMTLMGHYAIKKTVSDSVKNQLRLKDYLINYKNIETKFEDPMFIMGLPRTGTTYMHNLLIQSMNKDGLEFWELCEPIPYLKNKYLDQIFRKVKAKIIYSLFKTFIPKVQKMHPVEINSYEECWHLFKINLNIYNLDFQLNLYNFGDWLIDHTFDEAYNEYSKILEIIMENRNKNNLILKCPEHILATHHLRKNFPNSKFIWMHRDPAKTITSYSKMIYEIQKFYYGKKINKKDVGEFVTNKFHTMIIRGLQIKDKYKINYIDINYLDLKNNPIQALNKVHSQIKQNKININTIDSNVSNLKKLKNKESYSLKEFNISRKKINIIFKDYIKKFKIELETN